MLSKIFLPCFTASTIVTKLSSVKIISEAFFATSVPFFPIAIPMSAFFSAGASLTPSPVIATTAPVFWNASTMRTLCSGDTLANTEYLEIFFSSSFCGISSNSLPVIAKSPFFNIPNSLAIALAVEIWSPVIITVFIPAFLHVSTASSTPSLGGSIIPINPTNVSPCSILLLSIFVGSLGMHEYATAITLNALSAIILFLFSIFCIAALSRRCTSPFKQYCVQCLSSTSGAPLVIIKNLSFALFANIPKGLWISSFIVCIVLIIFLSESNGMSLILANFWYSRSLYFPCSLAAFTIASSVGSPTSSSTSVHIAPSSKMRFRCKSKLSPFTSITFVTCILFCVRVPVLSEQITLLLPKVSTAGSFLIIVFFLAIFVTPIESIIVTIAGSPSGIAATASPTEVINISTGSIFLRIPITNINAQMTKHPMPRVFPTSPSFFCIGVSGDSFVIIILAIFPTFVFIPISVTIASPCPFTTIVFAKAIFNVSPRAVLSPNNTSASFVTGTVSPVKLDSSIFKL